MTPWAWVNPERVADKDAKTHPETHRMVEKLATPAGRVRHAQRKWLVQRFAAHFAP